ncbi:MAG: DUF4143 domain-containing protein [Promicromonosporaceae bacterium]|nr:DUF4143 domain-containing protein [Promicromonosporaceae bacterium]
MNSAYLPRLVDQQLASALAVAGAVLLEGPRACGKTWTGTQSAASEIHLDRLRPTTLDLVRAEPNSVLAGKRPRLIDEWQLVPAVWNQVRGEIDDHHEPGQYILTGSASPIADSTRHTGAGRFIRLRMYPMSLFESGESDGSVSLLGLLNGHPVRSNLGTEETLGDIAAWACRGGFPAAVTATNDVGPLIRSYLDAVSHGDVDTDDGVRRDPIRMERLLFSLARNTASYVAKKTLAADLGGESPASPKTLDSYLGLLERVWLAVPQPAWGERLRSSAQIRRAPKWHLADPSLAASALGADPETLQAEPGAFGQVFETMVFRDLSVYAQAADAKVFSYRDNADREIDAVVVKANHWVGFEVKLAATADVVDQASRRLLAIAGAMRRPPAALVIVVPTGPSYQRDDGVNVVALTSLGP